MKLNHLIALLSHPEYIAKQEGHLKHMDKEVLVPTVITWQDEVQPMNGKLSMDISQGWFYVCAQPMRDSVTK